MFSALKTKRHYRCDESRKLRHIDVSLPNFVRNFASTAAADSISRLALTESIATSGRLATYSRNSYTLESLIQGISTSPDCPPCVTSCSSSAPVETRTSAPAGSFVSQEITQRCPKKTEFGFAVIFPVMSSAGPLLFTAGNQHQLLRQARVLQSAATTLSFLDARH